MPKIKLVRDITFPDGIKAKGEVVEVNKSTADWLIEVKAAEPIEEVKRGKSKTQPDNQRD